MEHKLRNRFRQLCGISLFKDELACAVKKEFRNYIGMGLSTQKAEDILIDFFDNAEGEPYDWAVCYLALADTEWLAGRLTDRIKLKALGIIDSGLALDPWKEACLVPKEEIPNIYDLVFEDEESGFFLFYGFCHEDTEAERQELKTEQQKDIFRMINNIPDEEKVSFKKSNYSKNIKNILVLSNSPQKNYEKRKEVLQQLKERLLSPMPKIKKYPKPELKFSQNDFYPGEVAVFRVCEGEYEGFYFAFEFLSKKENRIFMARDDIGIYYTHYGAFFDYFSKDLPELDTLKKRGFKPVSITKQNYKLYYKYSYGFFYNEQNLNDLLKEKYFDNKYLTLFEMKEANYCLRDDNAYFHFLLNNLTGLKKILIDATPFKDFDTSNTPRISAAEKIIELNDEIINASAHLYNEEIMSYELFEKLCEERFLCLTTNDYWGGSEKLTIPMIDTWMSHHDRIDKLRVTDLRQDAFEYLIENYGHKIKCLHLIRCHLVSDYSLLGKLKNLIFFHADGNYQINSLWDMSQNLKLEGLVLNGFTKLRSLNGIQNAPKLKHFSMYNEAQYSLDSLKPLVDTKLESLSFYVKSIIKKDLDVYKNMPSLKYLNFYRWFYTTEEIAYIAATNPNVKGESLCPYRIVEENNPDSEVIISGKRKPRLYLKRDNEKIQKYKEDFEKKVKEFSKCFNPD